MTSSTEKEKEETDETVSPSPTDSGFDAVAHRDYLLDLHTDLQREHFSFYDR